MNIVYFDTGLLVKLYCAEIDSSRANEIVRQFTPPYPITSWHEIEIMNAMRLKAFGKELTTKELGDSLANLQSDIVSGVFVRPRYDTDLVFRMAEELSGKFAASIGCRTLDVMHVAVAAAIGAKDFVTFDIRQAKLAKKAGLNVFP